MHSAFYLGQLVAFVASVNAHGVILAAQGASGPPSVGFSVELAMPRNCTLISPCQLDTTIMRQGEMDLNLVGTCGRTQLAGNIDIVAATADAMAAKAVTGVTKGGTLMMTIHQVNGDGAGPYLCDLDDKGDGSNFKGNLTVANQIPGANGLSQNKEQAFNITITLPPDMDCKGGSTMDVCIVRCRNNALAGPFGGCIAVEQTDKTGGVATAAAKAVKTT